MKALFVSVLNMSFTASIVILVVTLVRSFLKRVPKVYSYVLWAVVLFRLLCPVSFASPVSLLGFLDVPSEDIGVMSYVPVSERAEVAVHSEKASAVLRPSVEQAPPQRVDYDFLEICSWIWAAGAVLMLVHSILSYRKHRQMLAEVIPYRDNIYEGDAIPTPFVLGVFHPKIYLPSILSEEEKPYIIAHEQHHIHRKDHLVKLLAYGALCLHWFNPLAWLAFLLAGRDMEMSCDEAVVKKMGQSIRADYAESLLRLASGHLLIAGTPLSFGEGNIRQRILNLAQFRKPTAIAMGAAMLVSGLVMVVSALNPVAAMDRELSNPFTMAGYSQTSPDEVRLVVGKSPNNTDLVTTTSDHWLEAEKNRKWVRIPELTRSRQKSSGTEEVSFPPKVEVINLKEQYGDLPAGLYRIGKTIHNNGETGNVYAKFRIYASERPGTPEQLAVEKCYEALDGLKEQNILHYTITGTVGDVREVWQNRGDFLQLWTYPKNTPRQENRGRTEGILTLDGISYQLSHADPKDLTTAVTGWEVQAEPMGIFLETQLFRNTGGHIYFPPEKSKISHREISFLTEYNENRLHRYCRVTYLFREDGSIESLTWDGTNWYQKDGTITIRFFDTTGAEIENRIREELWKYPIR